MNPRLFAAQRKVRPLSLCAKDARRPPRPPVVSGKNRSGGTIGGEIVSKANPVVVGRAKRGRSMAHDAIQNSTLVRAVGAVLGDLSDLVQKEIRSRATAGHAPELQEGALPAASKVRNPFRQGCGFRTVSHQAVDLPLDGDANQVVAISIRPLGTPSIARQREEVLGEAFDDRRELEERAHVLGWASCTRSMSSRPLVRTLSSTSAGSCDRSAMTRAFSKSRRSFGLSRSTSSAVHR